MVFMFPRAEELLTTLELRSMHAVLTNNDRLVLDGVEHAATTYDILIARIDLAIPPCGGGSVVFDIEMFISSEIAGVQLFHDDDDVDFVLTNRSLEVGFCSVA
jgi:hypothetical protein